MSFPSNSQPAGNPEGLCIWVINLDRSPERWAAISARLQSLNLCFERLPAVDARALTEAQLALLDEAGFRRRHGMTSLPGELGCYLSHVEVIRRFLASKAEAALVLEDDVVLSDRLPAALAGLMRHPSRWDMVKLSAVHSGTPQRYLEVSPGQWLSVMLSKCTGSSAYLINRRAASAYAQGLLPMRLPYDHVFDQGWNFGIKVRLLTPPPCDHHEAPSTINHAANAPSRKFFWLRRFPAYGFRIVNELNRVAYGLREWFLERRSQ